jgi:flagellar biosynthesis/type III secretory pathway protein FliH
VDTDSGPDVGTQSGHDSTDDTSTTTTTQPSADPQVGILSAENRKWRKQAQAFQQELEQLKSAHATDAEQAIAKARTEGETAYKAKWRGAKVENLALSRLAAKGVTATELALKALDLSDIDVDDAGKVDSAAVDTAIEDALKRFPMLGPAQGDSGNDSAPPGLNGAQRRITSDELLKADSDKRNELLRFALGR